jgi:desulfoferrodoxin (superoxide reductase-like protein)
VHYIKWIIIYFNSKLLRMMCNQEAALESWTAQLHFVCMRDGGGDEQLGLKMMIGEIIHCSKGFADWSGALVSQEPINRRRVHRPMS